MNYIKLDRKDEVIRNICNAISYKGRKIKASLGKPPSNLNSFWDGGSKDTYYFYNLDTKQVVTVESNHPCFEPDKPRVLKFLPERCILIESSIFMGKHSGLTIYSNESDRSKLITMGVPNETI